MQRKTWRVKPNTHFAKKSIMNTKGMLLLPRGSQGNMNYWPKSKDGSMHQCN